MVKIDRPVFWIEQTKYNTLGHVFTGPPVPSDPVKCLVAINIEQVLPLVEVLRKVEKTVWNKSAKEIPHLLLAELSNDARRALESMPDQVQELLGAEK